MLFLQAAIDDSSSDVGDRRMFMAGYLQSAEDWAKFAVRWDKALRAGPAIDYLKMREAQSLSGQFRGWDGPERDKKLMRLARIIQRFSPFSFQVSVSRVGVDRLFKPDAPFGLGKPHFQCVLAVVMSVARYVAEAGLEAKIEFLFDRQDEVSADILLFLEYMCENLSDSARATIASVPRFLDDKDYLPLQAEDLLAWHVRREHEQLMALPMARELRNPDGHLVVPIEAAHLARMAKGFRKVPGVATVQSKAEWKDAKRRIIEFQAAGFRPPHGDWQEIHKATVEHLARIATASGKK